jgi:hypothetical protein
MKDRRQVRRHPHDYRLPLIRDCEQCPSKGNAFGKVLLRSLIVRQAAKADAVAVYALELLVHGLYVAHASDEFDFVKCS